MNSMAFTAPTSGIQQLSMPHGYQIVFDDQIEVGLVSIKILTPGNRDLTKQDFLPILTEAAIAKVGLVGAPHTLRDLTAAEKALMQARAEHRAQAVEDYKKIAYTLNDPATHAFLMRELGKKGYNAFFSAMGKLEHELNKFAHADAKVEPAPGRPGFPLATRDQGLLCAAAS